MTTRVLTPKRPVWLRQTVFVAAASLAVYAIAAWSAPWRPGRLGGLVFGTLAALLFVNAALYPVRRRWLAWPLRTAQDWLQLHVYGSVLALLFVLIHAGFAWPSGLMGWWLLGLSSWTTATGLLGVGLQKALPYAMSRGLRVEALVPRMPQLVEQLRTEADRVMTGASDALARVYLADVRPVLEAPTPGWDAVVGLQRGRERQLPALTGLAPFVAPEEQQRVADLQLIVRDKLELDAHLSVQRLLRWWPLLHVPPAMLLIALLVVHIVAVLLH